MSRRAALLACLAAAVPAADLLSELMLAAPRVEDLPGPADGDLGWLAVVATGTPQRIDGSAVVSRDRSAVDGQVATSLTWNHARAWSRYDFSRITFRAGSDPLAVSGGRALLGAQGVWSASSFTSCSVDAAWSADRGTVLAAEACLWFLRVRGERDGLQEDVRIGTGPRFLGSDGPVSGAVLVDYVIGGPHDGRAIDGVQAEAWLAVAPQRHLLVSAGVQAASRVRSADGSVDETLAAAIALGCTW